MMKNRFVPGAALVLVALVQGCARGPLGPQTRLYAIDQEGAARVCSAPRSVALSAGKPSQAAISVGNDGGWCAISVANAGQPYNAGLLSKAPEHGTVYIHAVGDFTRIDYTPDKDYAGADAYEVTLLPGQPILDVSVTVMPPGAPALKGAGS
jgi:hypothetical protein